MFEEDARLVPDRLVLARLKPALYGIERTRQPSVSGSRAEELLCVPPVASLPNLPVTRMNRRLPGKQIRSSK
jgi:hypothetical protein